MNFLSPELAAYIEAHTLAESPVLAALNRETHTKVLMPRMLSGHLQGQVLRMLSGMIRPKQILEIGTYTGYSAICLAEGLVQNGILHTIDINEELSEMMNHYFQQAKVSDKIKCYTGDAKKIIPTIHEQFDIVFIDADKENYSNYYDLIFDKVRKGGYIIADNVLWSGKVVGDSKKMDKDTKAILAFNQKVHQDTRVENVLFPIRDGLMIAKKVSGE